MANSHPQYQRCADSVAALNDGLRWGLDAAGRQRYAAAVAALPQTAASSDEDLRQLIVRYHLDHDLVESLQHPEHPLHEERWREWLTNVLRMQARSVAQWLDDCALDREDLVQMALVELIPALPSFHYGSRFTTWAYQIVTRSAQRWLRDSKAKKRAQRPGSLDEAAELHIPISDRDHPQSQGDAIVLWALVHAILKRHPDKRLDVIFTLLVEEDRSVAEIGAHVHLSPQRVRALLPMIYELLRADESLRAWLGDEESSDEE